jgi:hypothetical protein
LGFGVWGWGARHDRVKDDEHAAEDPLDGDVAGVAPVLAVRVLEGDADHRHAEEDENDAGEGRGARDLHLHLQRVAATHRVEQQRVAQQEAAVDADADQERGGVGTVEVAVGRLPDGHHSRVDEAEEEERVAPVDPQRSNLVLHFALVVAHGVALTARQVDPAAEQEERHGEQQRHPVQRVVQLLFR